MFRKLSKKKQTSKIRKREEGEDEEEDQSLQEKIRSTQKKQKILSSLPLVTGNPSKKSNKKANEAQSSDSVTAEMSVMEKKHHQLMQEYIEEKLKKDKSAGSDNANSDSLKDEEKAKPAIINSEEELYQELAREVYSLKQENQQVQEERGAVLVGGTGLAEVILPSSLSSQKGDQQQSKNRVYRKDASSSAVPASSSNTVLASSAPQFRSFRQHKTRAPTDEEKDAAAAAANEDENADSGDADRVGFNAYRGKSTERKPMVKKQRDDTVFSDFVKHQREKMMNRR